MDGFWSKRCLNYRINVPDKIGSILSGSTTSMVALFMFNYKEFAGDRCLYTFSCYASIKVSPWFTQPTIFSRRPCWCLPGFLCNDLPY